MQTSDQTWLVMASCPEEDVPSFIDRLTKDWQVQARNCPGGELPVLEFAHRGTWPLSSGVSQLRDAFRALLAGCVVPVACRGTILVVDDNEEVSTCLGVRLRLAGYNVINARDGEEGLAATIDHHPDAVVLDVRMPKKDGITMLREMRLNESVQRTPVVVLSANARDQHRALEAGANFFVSKPYEARAFFSLIYYPFAPNVACCKKTNNREPTLPLNGCLAAFTSSARLSLCSCRFRRFGNGGGNHQFFHNTKGRGLDQVMVEPGFAGTTEVLLLPIARERDQQGLFQSRHLSQLASPPDSHSSPACRCPGAPPRAGSQLLFRQLLDRRWPRAGHAPSFARARPWFRPC